MQFRRRRTDSRPEGFDCRRRSTTRFQLNRQHPANMQSKADWQREEQASLQFAHHGHSSAHDGHEWGSLLAAYEEACFQRDAALESAMAMLNRAALEQALRESDAEEIDRRASEFARALLGDPHTGVDQQSMSKASYSNLDHAALAEAQKEIERQRQRIETLKLAVHQEEDCSLRTAYKAVCSERDDAINRANDMVDREAWNSLHTLYDKVCHERDAALHRNIGIIHDQPGAREKAQVAEDVRARLKSGLARHIHRMVRYRTWRDRSWGDCDSRESDS
jgi:hypothetical protein